MGVYKYGRERQGEKGERKTPKTALDDDSSRGGIIKDPENKTV